MSLTAGLNMSHRKGMKFVRMCAAQDQALYPERLGKVYIINGEAMLMTSFAWCGVPSLMMV